MMIFILIILFLDIGKPEENIEIRGWKEDLKICI